MKSLLSKLYCIGFYKQKVNESFPLQALESVLLSYLYHPSFLKFSSFIDKLHLFISFLLT